MKIFKVQYIFKKLKYEINYPRESPFDTRKNEMDDGGGTKFFSSETVRNLFIWVCSSHFYKIS